MRLRPFASLLLAAFLCPWSPSCQAAEAAPTQSPAIPEAPLPSTELLEAAKTAGVPLRRATIDLNRGEIQPGDCLSFLATLKDGRGTRQWIIEVKANPPTKEDAEASPYLASQLFVSSGACANFPESRPVAFDVRFIGPFHDKGKEDKVVTQSTHVRLNPHFLGLGLDAAANLILKMRRSQIPKGFTYAAASKPFPRDIIAKSRSVLANVHLNPEEERAYAASLPAMLEFFSLSAQTPGMKDLMRRVIDVPWTALVFHGGRVKDFDITYDKIEQHDPGPWGDTHRLDMTVQILNKPVIEAALLVTHPAPPLLNTGGIVALVARPPGKELPRLTITLLGSDAAPSSAKK